MAIQDAIAGAIAELIAEGFNWLARRFGRNEVEAKRFEAISNWLLIGIIAAALIAVTVIYS